MKMAISQRRLFEIPLALSYFALIVITLLVYNILAWGFLDWLVKTISLLVPEPDF